jgi:hypothetical protein
MFYWLFSMQSSGRPINIDDYEYSRFLHFFCSERLSGSELAVSHCICCPYSFVTIFIHPRAVDFRQDTSHPHMQ